MSAVIEKPCPAAMSASTMPTSETGIVKSMTNGSRSDLNCDAMIMNTTMTARPSARPSPENVVRIELDLTDEVDSRRARVRGSALSAASRSSAADADVAPLGLHEHVRDALRGGCARRRPAPTSRRMLPYAPSSTGLPCGLDAHRERAERAACPAPGRRRRR